MKTRLAILTILLFTLGALTILARPTGLRSQGKKFNAGLAKEARGIQFDHAKALGVLASAIQTRHADSPGVTEYKTYENITRIAVISDTAVLLRVASSYSQGKMTLDEVQQALKKAPQRFYIAQVIYNELAGLEAPKPGKTGNSGQIQPETDHSAQFCATESSAFEYGCVKSCNNTGNGNATCYGQCSTDADQEYCDCLGLSLDGSGLCF